MLNQTLPRMPIMVEPTTILVVHTWETWVCNYSEWQQVSYPHPFRQCYSPHQHRCYIAVKERSCFDFGGLTVISVTSRLMAHDIGTVILRMMCYHVYICTILSASFQLRNCVSAKLGFAFMLWSKASWSHSGPFPLQHLHESYDQPVWWPILW